MEKFKLFLDNNLKERNTTDKYSFPFRVGYERLSNYEQNSFPIHWHPEVEFTYVTEGSMEYQANDNLYKISAGNGIFTNSNVLHTARTVGVETDCSYIAIVLNPVIIFGYEDSLIFNRYVNPICTEPELFSKYLSGDSSFGKRMISLLLEAAELQNQAKDGYELLVVEKLCSLWSLLFQELQPSLNQKETGTTTDINRLKTAIGFIQSHYSEDISLQDIAGSCHISKSECCHLFKRTLRQTPFTYLLNYRIQKSLPLLLSGGQSMTEIAEEIGFHGSSYFAETFKKIMNCSPSDYRKIHSSR
ncbi:AraC family transcriptional regulator [Kineothrix sedimenti]|uniref:AraC family transcriptional regulator n=1 Tax=Kineothrix sedimenti TaxID=3123317 RepID=A0ABZ3F0Y7_9FIRM